MSPLWNLVRQSFPNSTLVQVWGDSVEFRQGGRLWMATFTDDLKAIDGVWVMTGRGDDWDEKAQDQQEQRAFGRWA